MEPSEFDPKWWSHKFNGPGLRYEIAICIRTGDIVWAHGGVPCGEWPDLRLARNAFIDRLLPGEKAIADGGYRDHHYFDFTNGAQQRKKDLREKKKTRFLKQNKTSATSFFLTYYFG